jgi:hypothetical protein
MWVVFLILLIFLIPEIIELIIYLVMGGDDDE